MQTDLLNRMDGQEQAMSALDRWLEALDAQCVDMKKHTNQLQAKLLNLEAHSRRHNIKIVGIDEGAKEGRPTDFISKLTVLPSCWETSISHT